MKSFEKATPYIFIYFSSVIYSSDGNAVLLLFWNKLSFVQRNLHRHHPNNNHYGCYSYSFFLVTLYTKKG